MTKPLDFRGFLSKDQKKPFRVDFLYYNCKKI
jgi:hypothetical protein